MNDLIIREVNFQGDNLLATQYQDKIYIGVSNVCNGLGLSKGQKNRQIINLQDDYTLKQGCIKFGAGVFDPYNETIAIELNFLPLWLAKISITPKMIKENPALTNRLAEYQLKAKDVLSQAFLLRDRYFIPQSFSEALQLASNLQQQLEEQKPKIEMYDTLLKSEDLLNFSQVADTLELGYGRNTLLKELRQLGILMDNENYWNIPYSQYIRSGYFSTKMTLRKTDNGMRSICTTLCRPKALKLIKKVLDKKKVGFAQQQNQLTN